MPFRTGHQTITSPLFRSKQESRGAEALARWQQADGSYLSPEIFVALAHETGLTVPHPVDY
jgi:sensor c-di-GMP phosphodiesterase-like protein